MFVCLFVFVCGCLFVCLTKNIFSFYYCVFVCLYVCVFVCVFVCLCVWRKTFFLFIIVCLCVCMFVCLCVYVSVCLYVWRKTFFSFYYCVFVCLRLIAFYGLWRDLIDGGIRSRRRSRWGKINNVICSSSTQYVLFRQRDTTGNWK
jgi:hypothetical protein